MSLCPRRDLLVLLPLLGLGLPAPARADADIEDRVRLFSDDARTKARLAIDNIRRRTGKDLFIEGALARLMYRSLYKLHETALYGPWKTFVSTLARGLSRQSGEPKVKLH